MADPLTLDAQLCFRLSSAARLLTRVYADALRPLGITYPQYLVMLVLWEDGASSVGELGERLRLDSGTLTPLLKRLEAAGHVVRRRDPADERRVVVELTTEGKRLRSRAVAIPERLAAAVPLPLAKASRLSGDLDELIECLVPDATAS